MAGEALSIQSAGEQINELFSSEPVEPAEEPIVDEVVEEEPAEEQEIEEADGEAAESEDGEEEQPDSDESDGEPITNTAELSEAMGLSPDDLMETLKHKFTSNGEEVELTLKELERGHQSLAGLEKAAGKANEKNKALDADREAFVERQTAEATAMVQTAQQMYNIFAKQLETPEMVELQQSGDMAYMLRRDAIRENLGQLQQVYQQTLAQHQQLIQNNLADRLKKSQEELTAAVPDFGESHTKKIYDTLGSFGFSPDEIRTNPDSRVLLAGLKVAEMQEKIAAFEANAAKAKESVKKVKRLPKTTLKPTKAGISQGKASALRNRVRKPTNSTAEAGALINEILNG